MKGFVTFAGRYLISGLRLFPLCLVVVSILFLVPAAHAKGPDLGFLTPAEQAWLNSRTVPIRLAPDSGFAPVEIKGPNDELLGLAGDYIDIIESMLGITFDIVWYDSWAESVKEARKGNVDLWSAVVSTPQRKEYMSFSSSFAALQPVFVVPESDTGEISFATLGKKRLVAVEGWFHQDLLADRYPQITLSTVKSIKDGLVALQNGSADVLITDTLEASYMIRTLGLTGLRIAGDAPLKSAELRMACRKDWPIFKSILDKSLSRITEKQKREIYHRWISLAPQTQTEKTQWLRDGDLILGTCGGLVLLLVFLFVLLVGKGSTKAPLTRRKLLVLIVFLGGLLALASWWAGRVFLLDTEPRAIHLTNEERAWLDSRETPLIVAPDTNFAPIEWIDSNGLFKGIAADYLRLVEKKLGIRFRVKQIRNWKDNIELAKRHELDIWTAVAPTAEKRQYMNFATPHIILKSALIVHRDNRDSLTLGSMGQGRIAVVENYFTHDFIKQHYPDISLTLVADARAGIRALAFRQVDAVLSDIATASYVIEQEGISSLVVGQIVDTGYELAFASRKDWPILSRILDKAVISITPSEHRQIMEKWTGSSQRNGIDLVYAVKIGAVIAVVLVIVLLWSFSLKRLVRMRTKELGEAQRKLIQANSYVTNVINSMPSVLIGVDLDGNITQWNLEAESATGLTPQQVMGQPLAQVVPSLADKMEQVREAIVSGQKQVDHRQGSFFADKHCYEDVTIYPLIGEGPGGAVIRIDDITDKVRMEEMIVQSEKMLSVGGLAAGMAHEINNPLAGMMQSAEVLLRRLGTDMPANVRAAAEAGTTMDSIRAFLEARDVPKMLTRIRESGGRAAAIVSNMLDFARKGTDAVSNYSLAELLDRSVELAGSDYDPAKKYDFRKIKIIRNYAENLPLVICDAGAIQQVMLNILRNGAEAMQENEKSKEPCFSLQVNNEEQSGMVRVEIEDNGSGMSEETCKRIFEPFFTTKPVGLGTGLGLSVSYFIITENHGGEMSVTSRPGEGTRFTIRLPVEPREKGTSFQHRGM